MLLRKRVHRHIEHCAVCGARRAAEMRPASCRAVARSGAPLRLAAGLPEGLRAHTITIATGQGTGAVAHRAAVLSRAGAFTHGGFPPAHRGAGGPHRRTVRARAVKGGGPGAAGVG